MASLTLPLAGEVACGDAVVCLPVAVAGEPAGAHWLGVIDGLGHGALAALAAQCAQAALQAEAVGAGPGMAPQHLGDPLAVLRRLDGVLAGTRGAAVGLAWVEGERMRFAGVGNTRVMRWRAGRMLRLPSQYGVVGDGQLLHSMAGVGVQEIDLLPDDWLLLFTDGLDEMLHVELMLPEWQREPQRLCQHLMARWRNVRDDAAVLVCRVCP